ncbi:MAG: hypothetical protein WC549_00300 [Actinomycetota bacterium]
MKTLKEEKKRFQAYLMTNWIFHPNMDTFWKEIQPLFTKEREKWIDEINEKLDSLEVDLVETTSQEYDNGWNECNLKWDLRIIDLLEEIKTKGE